MSSCCGQDKLRAKLKSSLCLLGSSQLTMNWVWTGLLKHLGINSYLSIRSLLSSISVSHGLLTSSLIFGFFRAIICLSLGMMGFVLSCNLVALLLSDHRSSADKSSVLGPYQCSLPRCKQHIPHFTSLPAVTYLLGLLTRTFLLSLTAISSSAFTHICFHSYLTHIHLKYFW